MLYDFRGNNQPGGSSDGADPEGRLALGPDGTIYGTTSFGGDPSGDGTAWSIKLTNGTWVYNQIYKFNGNTGGSLPHSGLILATDGALYGTTAGGGLYGGGTFYKLVPNGSSWTYVTLHNFVPRDPNGDSPYGDLLYANNNFYGMNLTGGSIAQCVNNSNGCGTVFQFNLRTTHNFNGDGFSDIAWRDSSGNIAIWEMNGTTILNPNSSFVGKVPGQWAIVGQRDFNGDGKADLLWRDTSGNVAIWEMNGTAVLNANSSFVANVPTQLEHRRHRRFQRRRQRRPLVAGHVGQRGDLGDERHRGSQSEQLVRRQRAEPMVDQGHRRFQRRRQDRHLVAGHVGQRRDLGDERYRDIEPNQFVRRQRCRANGRSRAPATSTATA